ncbi:MAG: glycosyltransferase family 39 protein [Actinobacteria bacterium]|nr:glycosyltransferase family 39 protein [Actinomycetota bacterium]
MADGYGTIYQLAAGLGSLFYAFAGVVLLYYLGKRLFDTTTALIGAIAIWLATPLIYYMTMEPLMAHTISMFSITLFVFLWYVTRDNRRLYHWAILGVVGGLLTIVRYQDAPFLLIPVIDTVITKLRKPDSPPKSWLYYGFAFGVFFLAALLATTPQLYENKVFYGSPFINGYGHGGEGFIYWNSPKILYSLFSTQSGLVLWSPIMLLSFIGLFWFSRKRPLIGLLLTSSFLVQLYLVSSWWAPDQGHTFGNRMLLNSTVVFAIGLMQFIYVVKERKVAFLKYAVSLCAALILINGVLSGLYCFRIIGHSYSYTPHSYQNPNPN